MCIANQIANSVRKKSQLDMRHKLFSSKMDPNKQTIQFDICQEKQEIHPETLTGWVFETQITKSILAIVTMHPKDKWACVRGILHIMEEAEFCM